ncbi:type VI secretion system tip protein VgrG [Aquimarina sp. AD10]|uniref:Type IV secretion protein Rhs n=1 Tax=Aquimarina aggregata TaxID=1642818 RepID=A0A162WK37_9FLAO|nr:MULTISPECIES: type VI secretion system tip protein VgrG [Aquimarina]AXT61554.1 type VI secretion system tip protein VgrG [Aquimarina sp. AD10]KZS38150.1 type IV secretion protein Rhs [Aquimarina aggregata]RKM90038.1 type VI secretion system tip protein VgrG [Aquimarina sp. AD10]
MKDREIPIDVSYNVSTFDILVDGNVVDPGYQILSISISKEINRIPTAKIVIKDGDASSETFKISEEEDFIPGKSIVVKVGRDGENVQLFKGIIIKHAIKALESGDTRLVLDCRDESVKMTLGRHNFYYEERKDSEIIEEIIGRYSGLSKDIEATGIKHLEMVQHHVTDWDFMLMRAEANAKLVMVDDGKITIKKPETNEDAALAVLFGSTLIDFEAEMDARNQWKSVEAKSWDYGGQAMFETVTDSVPINELGNVNGDQLAADISPDQYELRHTGQVLEEELTEWTKATLQRSRLSKIRGRAKFVGFGEIKPGQMIELQGLGTRFTGNAYVSAIRHEVYKGSWYTHAQFGLDPDCYAHIHKAIADIPAAGLVPAINGLQIGKVVQLENDPEGENRILVRLPIIDNSARGVWARIATLDAGENRGSFFLPEIEDEVIVGFLNDDPREAIVLGMLNSSAKPAPIEAQDVNHEKGIVTRSGMRLHFHDDTKTITIDTPAGNSIILDEDTTSITITDQNDNFAKLNPDGIEINSPGDIKIEASGNIDIKAGMNMTLEATQISAKASASMEVKGATTSVSADGITEIKGSLVNIN